MAKVEIKADTWQLMQDIAKELGWKFHDTGRQFDNKNWSEAEGPEGMRISMYVDTHRARLQISPLWPRDESNSIYPYETRDKPRIGTVSVSPEKSAGTIARDIQRRILPEYAVQYKEGVKQLAEHNAYLNGQTELWQRLCNLCGDTYGLEHRRKFYVYPKKEQFGGMDKGYINNVRIDGPDSVKIELCSMSAKKAEAVLTLLKEWKE